MLFSSAIVSGSLISLPGSGHCVSRLVAGHCNSVPEFSFLQNFGQVQRCQVELNSIINLCTIHHQEFYHVGLVFLHRDLDGSGSVAEISGHVGIGDGSPVVENAEYGMLFCCYGIP
nr:hypothetical protein Iba_chr04eCG4240 [Ipomoea batatas]